VPGSYDEALARVLDFEGGCSNDARDPGGPTKPELPRWALSARIGSSVVSPPIPQAHRLQPWVAQVT
jgi:lysozyme family protein